MFGSDSDLVEHRPQLGRWFEFFRFGIHVMEPFEVDRSRNTTASFRATRVRTGPFSIRTDIEKNAVRATDGVTKIVPAGNEFLVNS